MSNGERQPVGMTETGKELPYTESFYPRSAEESETETLSVDEETTCTSDTPTPILSSKTVPSDNKEEKKLLEHDSHTNTSKMADDTIKGEKTSALICGVCFQVLLDPVSLGCGHTFCELCLAGMWKSSRQPVPLCPLCREPWGKHGDRLPSVNVVLRDIVEQQYPEELKEKHNNISESEQELLKSFNQARLVGARPQMGNRHRARVGVNMPIQRVFWIIITVFFVTMLIASFLASMLIWLFEIDEEYMMKPVKEWDNNDVLQWLDGLGESIRTDCYGVFERERINGPHLLSLTDKSLHESLLINNQYTRDSLLISINELKENKRLEPRNFKEFKAVNREEILLVTFLYNFHPRLTFLYIYLFKYETAFLPVVRSQLNMRSRMAESDKDNLPPRVEDDLFKKSDAEIFENVERDGDTIQDTTLENEKGEKEFELIRPSASQLIALAVETLLLPHVVVMTFVYTHFSTSSVMFYILMFHCGMSTFVELKLLRNRLRHPRGRQDYTLRQILLTVRNDLFHYCAIFFFGTIVYLVLPAVLIDLIFCTMLVRPLLAIAFTYLLKPCIKQTFRFFMVQANQRLNPV